MAGTSLHTICNLAESKHIPLHIIGRTMARGAPRSVARLALVAAACVVLAAHGSSPRKVREEETITW